MTKQQSIHSACVKLEARLEDSIKEAETFATPEDWTRIKNDVLEVIGEVKEMFTYLRLQTKYGNR